MISYISDLIHAVNRPKYTRLNTLALQLLLSTVKPRLHDTAGCQTGCTTGLTTVLNEQLFVQPVLNEQLFVQPVVKPGCTTFLTNGCKHDTAVCQSGLTTGCIV